MKVNVLLILSGCSFTCAFTFAHCKCIHMVHSHTGCLRNQDRDWDLDHEEWVVWFYIEPFTLHVNRKMEERVMYPFSGPGTVVCFNCMSMAFRCPVLVPGTANVKGFCIVSVSVLVPVRDTASVITPLGTLILRLQEN